LRKLYETFRPVSQPDGIAYWKQRAEKFGNRSVLDLRHDETELVGVTERQKDLLFPLLRDQLTGTEQTILDLGCGPGRFTSALAELIAGNGVGIDPIFDLLKAAPPHPSVRYQLMNAGIIPIEDHSVDVVWICIVLGGIVNDEVLMGTAAEIKRVLKPKGLLFLAENTTPQADHLFWKYRSFESYKKLFDFVNLKHLSDYTDLDERISVMAGR